MVVLDKDDAGDQLSTIMRAHRDDAAAQMRADGIDADQRSAVLAFMHVHHDRAIRQALQKLAEIQRHARPTTQLPRGGGLRHFSASIRTAVPGHAHTVAANDKS